MLRSLLVCAACASAASGQFTYDFNNLNGSDLYPYTLLHGQDNWTEQTFAAAQRCGVTATLSHDGTKALRFQEVGPGYGCDASRINDSNWLFPPFAGTETNAFFQADMLLGYWGGSFGLAYDANTNGQIRGAETGERGVRFTAGTQSAVQLALVPASGTSTRAPLASVPAAGGQWLRVRVVMDFTANGGAGAGSVYAQNLTTGQLALAPVAGLQNLILGLNPTANDASNPQLWHAVWLHFEGATYGLDNIEVGRTGLGEPYGAGCLGAGGPVALRSDPRVFGTGGTVQLVSDNHAPGTLGATIFGFSNTLHGANPLPLLLDPLLGTSNCSLLASIDVTVIGFTGPSAPALLVQPFPVPANWTGFRFYVQHACFEPVAGGLSWSNGLVFQLP